MAKEAELKSDIGLENAQSVHDIAKESLTLLKLWFNDQKQLDIPRLKFTMRPSIRSVPCGLRRMMTKEERIASPNDEFYDIIEKVLQGADDYNDADGIDCDLLKDVKILIDKLEIACKKLTGNGDYL